MCKQTSYLKFKLAGVYKYHGIAQSWFHFDTTKLSFGYASLLRQGGGCGMLIGYDQ